MVGGPPAVSGPGCGGIGGGAGAAGTSCGAGAGVWAVAGARSPRGTVGAGPPGMTARVMSPAGAVPRAAAASSAAAGAGSPASVRSAPRPAAYPWPTARTFQAPWRRYSSRATTAVSDSSPVSVYPASSTPSGSATDT